MPDSQPQLPRREWPLYTWELTPLCEVSDATWAVIGPILHPEGEETTERRDPYPWLSRLDTQRREQFVDFCVELDCWHEELEFAAYDLQTAVDFSYSSDIYDEASPHYRRLALIYHVDNIDHRIYAYREKVFQLLNLFVGDAAGSSKPDEFRKAVRDALSKAGLGRVVTLLNRLEDPNRTPAIADSLTRRRQLVHALAIREWKSLQARRRVEEYTFGLSRSDAVQQEANLEALIREGRDEIERLCDILALFRQDLTAALKDTTTPH